MSAGVVLLGGAVPAAAAALTAALTPAVSAGVTPAATSASTTPAWSAPVALPKTATPDVSAQFYPELLDCKGTGVCSAAGSVSGVKGVIGTVPVVDNETSAAWQKPELLPGITSLITKEGIGADVAAMSCGSPGNCSMGGDYLFTEAHDGEIHEAFVASEVNGHWGTAQNLPGLVALDTGESGSVSAISCAAPGYCTAAGFYETGQPLEYNGQQMGFTADEVAGKWQTVRPNKNLTDPRAVACTSPGNCTISYENEVQSDVKYAWGAPQTIKGLTALDPTVLSCASPGNCAVATGNQVASSDNGAWSAAKTVGDQQLELSTVSCGSPGNCVVGGQDATSNYSTEWAYTITEKSRAWKSGGPVPGIGATTGHVSAVSGVSCTSGGACAIDGWSAKGFGAPNTGFVLSQSPTATSPVQSFSAGGFGPVSCTASSCGALLSQYSSNGVNGFLDFTQKLIPTTTRLAQSSAKVTYGHERSEKLSVAVVPSPAGAASGTVSITTGKTLICKITLHSAKGSCTITPTLLKPGSYEVIATYAGDKHYRRSVSPARKVTVVK